MSNEPSNKKLNDAFRDINKILKDKDNKILVLDFSHFSPLDNGKSYDINFKFIAKDEQCNKNYKTYIKGLIDDREAKWRNFPEDKVKIYINFENKNKLSKTKNCSKDEQIQREKINKIKVKNDFDPLLHLVEDFPSSSVPGECFIIYAESHEDAQSVLYVLLKEKFGESEQELNTRNEIHDLITKVNQKDFWVNQIDKILSDLLIHEMVSSLVGEKNNLFSNLRLQAIRATISQVMARNVSHNLGSHVSYKATNFKIKSRIIELNSDFFKETAKKNKIKLNTNPEITEWIDYMSEKLDKYEIHRNEYLADYNLSPQSYRFYQDIILPFCENTLILDNLASAEGATYTNRGENKLKIRVFTKKEDQICYKEIKAYYPDLNCLSLNADLCTEIIYPDNFPYLLKNNNDEPLSDGLNTKKIEGTDVEVLMHSEQGLYSILENFIRNSAKHNKSVVSTKSLEIRLYLNERDDKVDLILCDNVSKLEAKQLFCKELGTPGLYQRLKNSVVGDLEKPLKQNLGFADMNINSFLFKYKFADVGEETLTSNLHLVKTDGDINNLTATKIKKRPFKSEKKAQYRFGFQIELLKPQKVLWIGEDIKIGNKNEKISSLRSNGIFHFNNLDEYLTNLKNIQSENAAFDFVVLYKNFNYEKYLKNQTQLPPKVLVKLNDDSCEKFEKPNIKYVDNGFDAIESTDELLEKCWIQWISRLKKKIRVYIYYEDNKYASEVWNKIELGGDQAIDSVNTLKKETIIDNQIIGIIYDHHGNAFTGPDLQYKLALEFKNNEATTNFYLNHSQVFFGKGSEDFANLHYPSDDNFKNKLLAYQLINAATTNIFVIDERIAITANNSVTNKNDKAIGVISNSNYENIYFSRYCYGKVFPINKISVDGSCTSLHSGEQKYQLTLDINLRDFILKISSDEEALSKIDNLNKDILVIHRTFLKKETLGMNVKEFLDLSSKTFGSVVVTSGGGYPHNLKEPLRFIPFSIIEQCINDSLSKLKLTNYLQKLKSV